MVLRVLRLLPVILLFMFAIMMRDFLRDDQSETFSEFAFKHRLKNISNLYDKWIVVRTSTLPTEAVKIFAEQKGWRVVVVADKDAPPEWDYFNCDFLSLEKQKELDYRILRYLPSDSSSRKMIGYLYAIANGARWIYDADNEVMLTKGVEDQFSLKSEYSGMTYGLQASSNLNPEKPNNLFNPYAYFGQAERFWPRGYPLEEVSVRNRDEYFRLCKNRKAPVIQLGLIAKEPDVDTIFRMANAKDTGLNINFNPKTPPILIERGTFSPINSFNTLFNREAFWALFLPASVPFHSSDIVRSYFVQKVLHLTGNTLGINPAGAARYIKSQFFLNGFVQERILHEKSGQIVQFLSNWNCKKSTLEKCFLQLSEAFSSEGFWSKEDKALIEAWITDLKTLGYRFPPLVPEESKSMNCRSAFLKFLPDDVEERAKMSQKLFAELEKWCTKVESPKEANQKPSFTFPDNGVIRNLQHNTVLIITANHPFGPWISLLQRLHEPFFAIVIFCGTIYHNKLYPRHEVTGFPPLTPFSYINVTEDEMQAGYRGYMCTSKAIEMNLRNITGYVVMSDDTVYNFWNDLDLSRFRLNQVSRQTDLPWWSYDVGLPAMNRAVKILRARTESEPNSALSTVWKTYSLAVGGDGYALLNERDVWGLSDWYYLPTTNATLFYELAEVFFEAQLFHEIAVPKIGAALQWLDFYKTTNKTDIGNCLHIWTKARNVWEEHYNKDLIYFHPIKLSFIGYTASDRLNYCQHVVHTFRDAIAGVAIQKT